MKPKKHYVSQAHLNKYDWLVILKAKQGLYCVPCVHGAGSVGGNPGGHLGSTPMLSFTKLSGRTGDLTSHA